MICQRNNVKMIVASTTALLGRKRKLILNAKPNKKLYRRFSGSCIKSRKRVIEKKCKGRGYSSVRLPPSTVKLNPISQKIRTPSAGSVPHNFFCAYIGKQTSSP